MTVIVGISGSLRQGSFNTALLRAAKSMMPAACLLDVQSIRAFPLYNGDDEDAHGIPDAVTALKASIAAADGLLIATPEYNNSIPGVLKNAIDWLSRPAVDIPRVFGSKPVAILGASTGGFGTVLSQTAWLPVLRTLGVDPWTGGRMMVSRANTLFDAPGSLTDSASQNALRVFVEGFAAYVQKR